MIARLPPNALVMPPVFMIPRMVNCFSPSTVPSGIAIVDAEMVLLGELLRQDDRVGLREKHERIVDDRFVAALEVVVAQAAVAGHVDAEHEQVALARDVRIDDRLDDRHRDADRSTPTAPSRGCPPRTRFRRPSPGARSCRRCDRPCARTRTARSGSPCACPTNTATPSTMPAIVSIVRSTCLRKYGQLISRSRIIGGRPRRCGRRAARSCAGSSPRPSCRA